MPGPLISSKEISAGAITTPKRDFDTRLGKNREAMVYFSFPTANNDYAMPHALGRKPTYFTVLQSGAASGTPVVSARDPILWATRNIVTLRSDTAASWAIVSIR